ncbi:prepilin-type N-terminal cleavage/methylation domain-containing protein [Aliamphritea spongicola]|uniref:prepilin-type N-terminal cleavage/methylation domain-containing protein n=1 Tax=Aliamphritea spongicola TaxID=707589 RepID=UPI00196A4CC2|nr:prepilin-type N-terminal cleavage/methylation domain-containing protein [Aliamphritea spongicola]MBN3561218.1 prepilin-type N-terminal cleavage/methylation domain-containing protein [Aliamphritea spongicola]
MLTIGQKKHQGFTLLELLVVLAIVATVSALVSARFGFNTDASEIGKLHKQLNAVIAKAQYLANLDRRPVRISVDAEKRSLLLEDKLVFTWSDSVTLTLAGASALTPSREFITFLPAGGNSGGQFRLHETAYPFESRELTVNWLTGEIRDVAL